MYLEIAFALWLCKREIAKAENFINFNLEKGFFRDRISIKLESNPTKNSIDKKQIQILWLIKSQVILLGIMGMFKKSVDLALKIDDFELAKEYANKPPNPKVQKILWLKIIRKMVVSNEFNDQIGNHISY